MDGTCYQHVLLKRAKGNLTIHVIGASSDSELWQGHPEPEQERKVFANYAEALSEIAETHKLKTIHLQFIGPECGNNIHETLEVPPMLKPRSECHLHIKVVKENYNKETIENEKLLPPDIVVFFNPGFTCPDYSWEDALKTIGDDVPFLVTTNTELEGVADVQYLLDNKVIDEAPAGLASLLRDEEGKSDLEETNDAFFNVNPYCGNRVRQNATMANDVFVKSRWIFGGTFGKKAQTEEGPRSKKPKLVGSGNTKKQNPALV